MAEAQRRLRAAADEAVWALRDLTDEHARLLLLVDRTALFREVAEHVRAATGVDASLVAPLEDDDLVVIRHWSGIRGRSLMDLAVGAGLGIGGRALTWRRPVVVSDYTLAGSITHHFDRPVAEEGFHGIAAVPITTGDGVAGVIYAALRQPGMIGDTALETIGDIGRGAGVAIKIHDVTDRSLEARVADERRRLAVDLHDSVGALLFGIGAEVRDLRSDSASPALTARLTDLERRVSEASAALREALTAIHDVPQEDVLSAAVQGACRAFEERTRVPARAVVLGEVPRLAAARRQVLVRAAREGLLNWWSSAVQPSSCSSPL